MKRKRRPTRADKKKKHGTPENFLRAKKEKQRKGAGMALNKELNITPIK